MTRLMCAGLCCAATVVLLTYGTTHTVGEMVGLPVTFSPTGPRSTMIDPLIADAWIVVAADDPLVASWVSSVSFRDSKHVGYGYLGHFNYFSREICILSDYQNPVWAAGMSKLFGSSLHNVLRHELQHARQAYDGVFFSMSTEVQEADADLVAAAFEVRIR